MPEVVVNLTERKFVARGLNGTENSNADLRFPSENVSIESIPIIVDFLDSLGICTRFELSEELQVVPRYQCCHQSVRSSLGRPDFVVVPVRSYGKESCESANEQMKDRRDPVQCSIPKTSAQALRF